MHSRMNTHIQNTKDRGHITTKVRTYIFVDTRIHEHENTIKTHTCILITMQEGITT